MPGPSRTRADHLAILQSRANCKHLLLISGALKTGFSFHPDLAVRTTPDLLWSLNDWSYPASQGYWTNVIEADGALVRTIRIAADFVINLYVGLPQPALASLGRIGDLTGQTHEPFSRGEHTNHPGV